MGTNKTPKRPVWWPTAEQKAHADADCGHPYHCNLVLTLDVGCPTCRAQAGTPCQRPNGDPYTAHHGKPQHHVARTRRASDQTAARALERRLGEGR